MEGQSIGSGKDLGAISKQPAPVYCGHHHYLDHLFSHRDPCGHLQGWSV